MDARHDPPWWRQRFWLVLIGFMAIGGFLLLTEHRAHVLGVLPFLLLLICPMMHLFMHHGHGHHQRRDDAAAGDGHTQHGGGPHAR
jgi:choline-glycine betaine transporter